MNDLFLLENCSPIRFKLLYSVQTIHPVTCVVEFWFNFQGILDSKANQNDMDQVQEKLAGIPSDLVDQLEQLAKNLESLRLDRDSVSNHTNCTKLFSMVIV